MATLPETPTPEVIEDVFEIMKLKLEYANEGAKKQDEHGIYDTNFGTKAVAYDKLVGYLNSLDSAV